MTEIISENLEESFLPGDFGLLRELDSERLTVQARECPFHQKKDLRM